MSDYLKDVRARIHNKDKSGYRKYDVFYVFQEDDKRAKSVLVKLRDGGLKCCTLEEHCAGKLKFTAAQDLTSDSRKVVLAVSDWFINCKELMAIAESIVYVIQAGHAITLCTTQKSSFVKYLFLQRTNIITALGDVTESDCIQQLVQKIEEPVLEFCCPVGTYTRISDILLLRGLSYQVLEWSVYGLHVSSASRILRIDVPEYINHQKLYEHYNIGRVCGMCKTINHMDTKISLTFTSETPPEVLHEVKPVVADLCARLIDTESTGRTVWSLACTVNEHFKAENVAYLNEIYNEAFDALGKHSLSQVKELKYPQFCTEDQRLKSYGNGWSNNNVPSAYKMAAAGFFYESKSKPARCFYCGSVHMIWKKDDEPLEVHAMDWPTCGYVEEKMTPQVIEKLQNQRKISTQCSSCIKSENYSDVHSSVEKRVASLRDMSTLLFQELTGTNEDCSTHLEDHRMKIAETGFYHIGPGARLACFACSVRVFKVSIHNDPWVVHAKVSPNCPWVRQTNPDVLKMVRSAQVNEYMCYPQPISFDFMLKTYDRRIFPENTFQPTRL